MDYKNYSSRIRDYCKAVERGHQALINNTPSLSALLKDYRENKDMIREAEEAPQEQNAPVIV